MIDRFEILSDKTARPDAERIMFCDGTGGCLFDPDNDLELFFARFGMRYFLKRRFWRYSKLLGDGTSEDMKGSRIARLTFLEEDRQQLRRERFEHPHPRVQLLMEVLWLISCGESYSSAARLADVSHATVDRYVAIYREHGIEGLKQFDWKGPTSELAVHQKSLEELFLAAPPHTTAEACRRIEEATGVKRGLTQVRRFLKKVSD